MDTALHRFERILKENDLLTEENLDKCRKLICILQSDSASENDLRRKIRHFLANLNPNNNSVGNPRLLFDFLERDLYSPDELARLTPQQMFQDRWKDAIKQASELQNLSMCYTVPSTEESMIKCGKCKKNKVEYTELQTRSADRVLSQSIAFIVSY